MGRRTPGVQCWSLLIKINILGCSGCDAGCCWAVEGRRSYDQAGTSTRWGHGGQAQAAVVTLPPVCRGPGWRSHSLTSPPHQPPVVTLVRPRLVRSVVQWQWVKSDSEPLFLPVYLSQIFPKFTKGFKTFQPFEVDILLLVKAEPISQIVCIQRIRSSFEPGASPGQSPALVQTCKRCYIYTIFGEGS